MKPRTTLSRQISVFHPPLSKSDVKKSGLDIVLNQTIDNSSHVVSNLTSGIDIDIEIKYSNLDYRIGESHIDRHRFTKILP